MALKTITRAELEQHNTDESCWMVMDGKVYDVSQFLKEHPGGEEVMIDFAGKDATMAFRDVGHSKDAQDMTKDYLIGELPEEERKESSVNATTGATTAVKGASFTEIMTSPTWSNFIIPTAIGIIVYVLYKGALRLFA